MVKLQVKEGITAGDYDIVFTIDGPNAMKATLMTIDLREAIAQTIEKHLKIQRNEQKPCNCSGS